MYAAKRAARSVAVRLRLLPFQLRAVVDSFPSCGFMRFMTKSPARPLVRALLLTALVTCSVLAAAVLYGGEDDGVQQKYTPAAGHDVL